MIKSILRAIWFAFGAITLFIVSFDLKQEIFPFEKIFVFIVGVVYAARFIIECIDFYFDFFDD